MFAPVGFNVDGSKVLVEPLTYSPVESTFRRSVDPAPRSTVDAIVAVPRHLPTTVLLDPVVTDLPASSPIPVLFVPVVSPPKLCLPTAVLLPPVVSASRD